MNAEFVQQVKIMRELQKEYFANRSIGTLEKCKQYERRVDIMIKDCEEAQARQNQHEPQINYSFETGV
jgi:hypothetical protein